MLVLPLILFFFIHINSSRVNFRAFSNQYRKAGVIAANELNPNIY
jgi:hypothetical protein